MFTSIWMLPRILLMSITLFIDKKMYPNGCKLEVIMFPLEYWTRIKKNMIPNFRQPLSKSWLRLCLISLFISCRSAFTLRNEERNASPVNNGRSSENVRSRGGKVEGASRRPASASVKTRSSLTGSGDRPRSVAPPGGGSRSGFSLRNRPSSAKQHQGQGDADPHSPRSTNMKRGR